MLLLARPSRSNNASIALTKPGQAVTRGTDPQIAVFIHVKAGNVVAGQAIFRCPVGNKSAIFETA